MPNPATGLATALLLALWATPLAAQTQFYPAQKQSQEQQAADAWECHQWATKTTGVDPLAMAQQETKPAGGEDDKKDGLAGAAARGASHGLLAGELFGGDLATHAAFGGGFGALRALRRHRKEMEQQHQTYTQAYQQRQSKLADYDKAVAACMKGRGYTTD